MTVREAFSLAFGEVPEGAVCRLISCYLSLEIGPRCSINRNVYKHCAKKGWGLIEGAIPCGPDISNRPAESFLGFFGEKYDKAVQGG